MSNIYEVIAHQRALLARKQGTLLSDLQVGYGQALAKLMRESRAILGQKDIPNIVKQAQLIALVDDIQQQMIALDIVSSQRIALEQQRAIVQSNQTVQDMIEAYGLEPRVNTTAVTRFAAAAVRPGPIQQLLARNSSDSGEKARTLLLEGTIIGANPLEIALGLRDAMQSRQYQVERIARTEVLRAYRGAIQEQNQAQGFSGVVWVCAPDACAYCWAMSGSIYPNEQAMDTHPNCRCSWAPNIGSDNAVKPGEEAFAELTPEEQLDILGPSKYAAYNNGQINLRDLAGHSTHPIWGRIGYEKTLGELGLSKTSIQTATDARMFRLLDLIESGEYVRLSADELDNLLNVAANDTSVNLEHLDVEGTGNKNVFNRHLRNLPREAMPQLPETAEGMQRLSDFLGQHNLTGTLELVDPRTLIATQNELDSKKVAGIYEYLKANNGQLRGGANVLVVSNNGGILDGHHRWASLAAYAVKHPNNLVQVLRVNTDIDTLLDLMRDFSRKEGIASEAFGAGFRPPVQQSVISIFERNIYPNETGNGGDIEEVKPAPLHQQNLVQDVVDQFPKSWLRRPQISVEFTNDLPLGIEGQVHHGVGAAKRMSLQYSAGPETIAHELVHAAKLPPTLDAQLETHFYAMRDDMGRPNALPYATGPGPLADIQNVWYRYQGQNKPVTPYAAVSANEYKAETISKYIYEPDLLRLRDPYAYYVLSKHPALKQVGILSPETQYMIKQWERIGPPESTESLLYVRRTGRTMPAKGAKGIRRR